MFYLTRNNYTTSGKQGKSNEMPGTQHPPYGENFHNVGPTF